MRKFPMLICAAALLSACRRHDAVPSTQAVRMDAVSAPAPEQRELKASGLSEGIVAADASASEPREKAVTPVRAFSDSIVGSMLIRTGTASMQVDSIERGIRAVRALAARVGGYVANSSISSGGEQTHSATLELKLPAARFDDAVNGLQPIGVLESVNVSAEDVGEEYVDVAARAANGRKLEQRLIEILSTRTGKLSDVLAVERELGRVREEIERQEGRLRYLRTRAAMSTLSVTVHEKGPVVAGVGTGGVLAEAFRQAWRNFISFTASAIAALGTLLPLALLLGAVVWGAWRVRRGRRLPPPGTAT